MRVARGLEWLAKLKLFELFHYRPRGHPIFRSFKILHTALFQTQLTASVELDRPKIVHSNLLNRQIMDSPRVPDALIEGAASSNLQSERRYDKASF